MYSREVIDVTHDCRNLHIGFFSDTKVDLSDFSTYSFCWALHIYFCSYDLDVTSKLQNCRKCSFASFSLWVGFLISDQVQVLYGCYECFLWLACIFIRERSYVTLTVVNATVERLKTATFCCLECELTEHWLFFLCLLWQTLLCRFFCFLLHLQCSHIAEVHLYFI